MQRNFSLNLLGILAIAATIIIAVATLRPSHLTVTAQTQETQGSLQAVAADGKPRGVCPLKHTDVKAEISGFLSRVVVTQEFANPFSEKIEAVYTFPLPQDAAVDDMTMIIGDRTVRGKILRREEAQAVYEAAKTNGQRAALLDQERPNIFTQSVANILPGDQVKITISYVETLKYESGSYEFVFPMVVAPRYIPGQPTGTQENNGNGFAPDTDHVVDASRITPLPAPPGLRAGHDISIDIALDAGVPIDGLNSKTHEIDIERADYRRAHIHLKNIAEIPNKDFILRYDVAGAKIEDALLTHTAAKGGFFTLILQPPERVTAEDVMPKELVFVLDTSGSMSGFPIEKAKETMKLAMDNLYPSDTFNLITFSGDEHILFPAPVAATKENLAKAQTFLESRRGSGGTEMMKAIKASMDPSDAQDHVRIVCFMTDGEVGNDMEIIAEVQKHPNARVFAFGIGGSVNRFLLDNMAKYGRGEVEYVGLNDDGSAAARRFHERVRNPLLTDISVDWNGLPVADVYPQRIPDLFGAKPLILTGRYTAGASGVIRLKGKLAGHEFVREIPVNFSVSQQHDVLATLWARSRVADLMGQDYNGIQRGAMREDLKQTITQLGLEYRLMTQFTSFVAVEEMVVTDGGQPRRVDVPVEIPEGIDRRGVFGEEGFGAQFGAGPLLERRAMRSMKEQVSSNGGISGGGGQLSSPISGGVLNGKAVALPTPAYPNGTRLHVSGTVTVQVVIDESGKVISAKAVSGHPLLAPAAIKAALAALFTPTMLSGRPIKVSGVINYNFADDQRTATPTGVDLNNSEFLTEEQRFQLLLSKLHPSVAALVQRLKDKSLKPAGDEAKFVRDDKAEIQVWLTEKSEETLAELKKLGFEVVLDPKTAKLVIGRLPIDKIAALAELKSVRYVAPQALPN